MAKKKIALRCVVCTSTDFDVLFSHKNGEMAKCRTCGLVQVVPMPSEAVIKKLYHEDFEHFAPYLEQLDVHKAYFQKKISEMRTRIPTSSLHPNFLDIGCAMGVLLQEAKREGMKVTGVDISDDAVAYCNRFKLNAKAGTVQSLESVLENNSFDIITAFQIIEHERDPLEFMRRVYKLLKKGGLVVLATPNYGGIWRKLMGKRWVGFTHPEHVVLLDFSSMRYLLEKSGFRDIKISADSPRPFPLSFAFKRAGDYFPALAWILKPIGTLLDQFNLKNPINPWDDMIIYAHK